MTTPYIAPSTRSYGYKIGAVGDWNILVNDMKNHEERILALEASGGVTTPTNIPLGGIILWSGAIVSIPAGFDLCDGNNGTPDLTDKFVIGAGDTYAPDDEGGASTHSHSGGSTGTSGSHTHSFSGTTGGPSSTTTTPAGTGVTPATSSHTHSFSNNTGSNGSHSHSVGNTGTASSLPPYYALAFIMRTS